MHSQRSSLYIDAFNVYHRIDDYQKQTLECYKWLNYRSLFSSLLSPGETIEDIYFFTSIPDDSSEESKKRHADYIKALETLNIHIVKGYFSKKKNKCPIDCNHKGSRYYDIREEKQTDVKIALYALRDGFKDKYDNAYIMSSDSDLVPIFEMIRELSKNPILITPPYDDKLKLKPIKRLEKACYDKNMRTLNIIYLKFNQLKGHGIDKKIYNDIGELIVEIPEEYQPFPEPV